MQLYYFSFSHAMGSKHGFKTWRALNSNQSWKKSFMGTKSVLDVAVLALFLFQKLRLAEPKSTAKS